MFKLWSELNQKARKELKPDFGLRSWGELSEEEKYTIWKYLERHFFDKNIREKRGFMGEVEERYYQFFGDRYDIEKKQERVYITILRICEVYKAQNYAPTYLEHKNLNSACYDFYAIFSQKSENVVLELLSTFAWIILNERKDKEITRKDEESDEAYSKRLETWRFADFHAFASRLNEVFDDFSLNVNLTPLGFTPKQDSKIEEEIYKPVLKKLSNSKWKEVSRDLSDAFDDYRNKDYSGSITHTISAVQAFLQVLIHNKTGKGAISDLLKTAKKKGYVPADDFGGIYFEQVESHLARTRQDKGDPHPKKEYATEKNARLVLNLAMVFFEHCL